MVHDLKDMYDFCCEEAEECEKELDPNEFVPLRFKRNVEGLSPLALAAAMGNKDMFEHILKKNTLKAWTYGPVVCYMVPLLGMGFLIRTRTQNIHESCLWTAHTGGC